MGDCSAHTVSTEQHVLCLNSSVPVGPTSLQSHCDQARMANSGAVALRDVAVTDVLQPGQGLQLCGMRLNYIAEKLTCGEIVVALCLER